MATIRRWAAAVPSDVWFALGLVLLLRVVLSALGLVLWLESDLPGPCHFEIARNNWADIPPLADGPVAFPLVGIWERWDACWYAKIATFGYLPDGSTTFHPLLPAALWLAGLPLGGNVALAGLVVSGVALFIGLVGVQRLVADDLNLPVARRTAWLIIAWPAALYLVSGFTEALFLATTVWTFRFARRRQWLPAAVGAALAVATRLPGLLLVLPLAWEAGAAAWEERRQRGTISAGRAAASVAAIAAPVVALVAIVAYQQAVTGTNLFESQDAWGGREFHAPWETIAAAWEWVLNGSALRGIEAVNLFAILLCAGLVVAGIGRVPTSYLVYAGATILLLSIRLQPVPLTATVRYLGVVFPCLVIAAVLLQRPFAERSWLVASAALLGLLTVIFVRGSFVA